MNAQVSEDGQTAKAVIVENTSKSKLYALIIGISKYAKITPLKGAVNDANEFLNFLTYDLKVPSDHLTILRDESASRANIIKGLQTLREDPRINKGDPILVYYAGHGGSRNPPVELKASYGAEKMQFIFPQDYNVPSPESGEPINCIPDKTIAALLNDLAAAKGDNITVIFDCCHSASGTRTDSDMRYPRSAEATLDIPADIDKDILPPGPDAITRLPGSRLIEPLFCTDQRSHVHLAACGKDEKAWEENDRGAFTVALLKTIRAHGIDQISYDNLVMALPNLPKQSPHCYGHYITRLLFNARVPSRKIAFIPVEIKTGSAGTTFLLKAGASSGVTYQSVWELHDSPTEHSASLGEFYAQTPNVSTTLLKPKQEDSRLPAAALKLYARQIGSGTGNELKVWFSPEAREAVFGSADTQLGDSSPGSGDRQVGYVAHKEQDSADVTVELSGFGSGGQAIFKLNDPLAKQYDQAALTETISARRVHVEKVLFAAAKWHWHLHRAPPTLKPQIDSPTANEATVVKGKTWVKMELVSYPGNTGADSQSSTSDSRAALQSGSETGMVMVQEGVPYGIKVTNYLGRAVHVEVLYFNPTNFSFALVRGRETANGVKDTNLPARDHITIYHGTGLKFRPTKGLKVELGYLKLFWSTHPLELPKGQKSPFGYKGQNPGRALATDLLLPGLWGTALLAVMQTA